MARAGKVERCIFCGEMPCACNVFGQPRKGAKKTKRTAKPATPSNETVTAPDREVTPEAELPTAKPKQRFARRAAEAEVEAEVDPSFAQAIQNLEPILAPKELKRFAYILHPTLPSDVERRLIEWKGRHESPS